MSAEGELVHVPRPDEAAHKAAMAALTTEADSAKAKLQALATRIEGAIASQQKAGAAISAAKATFDAARTESQKLKGEFDGLIKQVQASKAAVQASLAEAKTRRSQVKYASVEEIDKRLAQLEMQQATSTMSLRDEKELVREIGATRAQRTVLAAAADAATKAAAALEADKALQKDLNERITTTKAAYTEAIGKTNAAYEALQALQAGRKPKGEGLVDQLFKERDAVRATLNEAITKKKALYEKHDAEWTAYKAYLTALREKERVEREAAAAAAAAAAAPEAGAAAAAAEGGVSKELAADLAEFHPYAKELEEIALLSRFLSAQLPKAEAAPAKAKAAVVVEGPDGKPLRVGPKVDDELADLQAGGKKGGKKAPAAAAPSAARLVIDFSILSMLGKHGLSVPRTAVEVPAVLEAVAAKKTYYESHAPAKPAAEAAAPAESAAAE